MFRSDDTRLSSNCTREQLGTFYSESPLDVQSNTLLDDVIAFFGSNNPRYCLAHPMDLKSYQRLPEIYIEPWIFHWLKSVPSDEIENMILRVIEKTKHMSELKNILWLFILLTNLYGWRQFDTTPLLWILAEHLRDTDCEIITEYLK
jgi:hypothetical protein